MKFSIRLNRTVYCFEVTEFLAEILTTCSKYGTSIPGILERVAREATFVEKAWLGHGTTEKSDPFRPIRADEREAFRAAVLASIPQPVSEDF